MKSVELESTLRHISYLFEKLYDYNPAQVYTDAKWEKLEPDKRGELEIQ